MSHYFTSIQALEIPEIFWCERMWKFRQRGFFIIIFFFKNAREISKRAVHMTHIWVGFYVGKVSPSLFT